MEKNLLLVDDEENVIRSLRRLFRQEPYTIFSARSGAEGLEILEQQSVSVILSDQRMPGMIGSEFLKIVKDLYPNTMRIVMSGYTELESITSAINDGAIFKFLLKPWDDEKLLNHIREAFSYYELRYKNLQLTEELKAANEALELKVREEQERNTFSMNSLLLSQSLLDRIPVAVFGISDEGMIVMANQYARKLVNSDALIGLMVDDILPSTIACAIRASMVDFTTENRINLIWPTTQNTVVITPIYNNQSRCLCVSVV